MRLCLYSSFGRNTVQVPEKKLVIIINFILIKTPEPFLEYIQNFSIGVIASFEIYRMKRSTDGWCFNCWLYFVVMGLTNKLADKHLYKVKNISSVISQTDESQNGCFKKKTHVKFSKKRTFLTLWYAHVRVRIRGSEMFDFGKFGALCFLETPILRFALLPYYRRSRNVVSVFKVYTN